MLVLIAAPFVLHIYHSRGIFAMYDVIYIYTCIYMYVCNILRDTVRQYITFYVKSIDVVMI